MKRFLFSILAVAAMNFPSSAAALTAPATLTVTPQAYSVVVSWSDTGGSSDHQGFRVYRQDENVTTGVFGSAAARYVTSTPYTTNWLDTGVSPMGVYRYFVRSCNNCNDAGTRTESGDSIQVGAVVPEFNQGSPWYTPVTHDVGSEPSSTKETDVGGSGTGHGADEPLIISMSSSSGTPYNFLTGSETNSTTGAAMKTYCNQHIWPDGANSCYSPQVGEDTHIPCHGALDVNGNADAKCESTSANETVPIPNSCTYESGSDGHMAIISADRQTVWEFWHVNECDSGGIHAETAAEFKTRGWNGTYPTCPYTWWGAVNAPHCVGYTSADNQGSARGSGFPLTISPRPEEALYGFNHAFGASISTSVCDTVHIYPLASGDDCHDGSGHVQYGERWVLCPNFPVAGTTGRQNLITALKTYGIFFGDKGSTDFEIDGANSLDPQGYYTSAGFSSSVLNSNTGSGNQCDGTGSGNLPVRVRDFRVVTVPIQ